LTEWRFLEMMLAVAGRLCILRGNDQSGMHLPWNLQMQKPVAQICLYIIE
jgi:hypothetical protein